MSRSLDELFERGREFLKSIKPNEKVALIYHKDVDGICSGALIKLGLERLGVKVSTATPSSYKILAETIRGLKFDKLIIVDVGWAGSEFMRYLAKPTLHIDHHMIKEDINSDKIIFINPRFTEPEVYQPASYIVCKLLSGVVNIQDKEWLAVLGTVGDYAFEDCKDLLEKWVDVKSRDELLEKTKFGKAVFTLVGALFELGFEKVISILLAAKGLDEILENKELKAAYKKYENLYEKDKERFWKNAETVGKIIFSTLKPAHEGMGSAIVNEISRQSPDKIILLFEDLGDKYDIDARCQDIGVDIGKLMEKICGGGGHKNAAGGLIDKNELEDFKKRVMAELDMV